MKRVVVYGCAVWAALVAISLILLPAEGKHEALYESIKLTALVAAVLGCAIRYLRHHAAPGTGPALLIGAAWALVCTALDLVLYAAGAFNIGLDVYFSDVASSYMVMPVITALTMTFLRFRTPAATTPAVATPAAPPAPAASDPEPKPYIPVGGC